MLIGQSSKLMVKNRVYRGFDHPMVSNFLNISATCREKLFRLPFDQYIVGAMGYFPRLNVPEQQNWHKLFLTEP